jgi:hypothetical protein
MPYARGCEIQAAGEVSKVQDDAREKTDHADCRIVTLRLLALVVALSFPAALVPLAKVSAAGSTMACCVGKKENHCHASAKSKQAAGHEHTSDSSNPAFKSALKARCSDCCACAVSTRQQREKGKAQLVARLAAPPVAVQSSDERSILFSSSQKWAPISPRGPPSFLL